MRTLTLRTAFLTVSILVGLAACERTVSVQDASGDLGRDDRSAPPDAVLIDADPYDLPETPRVRTCSEIRITAARLAPGGLDRGYPGSLVTLTGDDLAVVEHVSVGGVEQPFERVGDTIVTRVPPMTEVGPQAVSVQAERCMTSRQIVVSRLIARAGVTGGRVALLDALDLTPVGALDVGLGRVVQMGFSLDGAVLLARGDDGTMTVTTVGTTRTTTLATRARGPFVLAQGTVVPSLGLLVVPSATPAGVLRLDTSLGTALPYEGPASHPLGVATSLDGFRALVLDESAVGYALDRPFAATPAWVRFGALTGITRPAAILMAQGGAVGPLGAVYDATDPPALVPMNVETGALGERVVLPHALGNGYFVSGDIVAFDASDERLLTADITSLGGVVAALDLVGESAGGVVRTTSAVTLYTLGALVLRERPGSVPSADVLHIVDMHLKPEEEVAQVPVAGARGVVGVQGRGNPFYVWTARSVVRIPSDAPSERRVSMAADGEPDVGLVAIQR